MQISRSSDQSKIIENVLKEAVGKITKRYYFKGVHFDPSDIERELRPIAEGYFDSGDISIDARYSSYYQQDPKWYGYADIEVKSEDASKFKSFLAALKDFARNSGYPASVSSR